MTLAPPRMHGLTHVPGGPDPIPGLMVDRTASLYDLADGVWPLNETAGLVAHDVSGNNHHLTSVRAAVVWGRPAGPPGTLTPEIHSDRLAYSSADSSHVLLTGAADNFSAAVWVFVNNRAGTLDTFIGFGAPIHSLGDGWQISQDNSSFKFRVDWAAGAATILSNAALPDNTWFLVGISREAGVMKLYINGAQQTATSTAAPTASTGSIWLGSDDYNYPTGTFSLDGRLSCAAYWGTHALTAAEHHALYTHPGAGGPADGDVWTSDGAGGASWEPPADISGKVDRDAVEAATNRLVAVKLAAADTVPAFRILGNGQHEWGPGGATVLDTFLRRNGTNWLITGGRLDAAGTVVAASGLAAQVMAGDVFADGRPLLLFGSAGDTAVYRAGASQVGMSFPGGIGNRAVEVGAPDSGGTGFRMVRIAN